MPKVSIVGAGRVGSTTALMIAMKNLADVMLVDIVEKLPQGEALDIMHAAASGFRVEVKGSNDFTDIKDSDIIINTAGMARRPGMDRLDLLNRNIQILKSIADNIKKHCPYCIVIQVSNPMDVMTHEMRKFTGFQREMVMGMGGMLDSQRLSYYVAGEVKAKPMDIKSIVIGEHGESQVPLFSQSTLNGDSLDNILNDKQKQKITSKLRNAGSEVTGLKGATIFAPAIALSRMVDSILNDRKEVMPCSACLEGEYGHEGISIGVPVKLGRKGIEKIVEVDITDDEKAMFDKSAKKLEGVIEELKL